MRLRCLLILLFAFAATAHAEPAARAFSLTDTDGRVHTLDSYRGHWLLLNLWATWCAPCISEMPELQALSQSGQVSVLGLAVDGKPAKQVLQFASRLKVSYPLVAGDAALASQFAPRGYPTSLLFDPSGREVMRKEGPVTKSEVEALVKSRR